jgi:hypothetical protein
LVEVVVAGVSPPPVTENRDTETADLVVLLAASLRAGVDLVDAALLVVASLQDLETTSDLLLGEWGLVAVEIVEVDPVWFHPSISTR